MTLHFSDYEALKIHGINDLTEYRSVTVFQLAKSALTNDALNKLEFGLI